MGVVRLSRMFGGGPRLDKEPAPGWDKATAAMTHIGEWLSTVPTKEGQYRVLAYWMWRLKSDEQPHIQEWVEAIAEESAVKLATEAGFKGGVEK